MLEPIIAFAGIVVVILLAFLCVRSTSAESIGKEGEYEVAGKLKRLPSDEYFGKFGDRPRTDWGQSPRQARISCISW